MNNGVIWIRYYKCPQTNINDNQELVNHGLEQVSVVGICFAINQNEDTKWGGVRRHMHIEDRQCNGQ